MQMNEPNEPAPLPGLSGGLPELTRYFDLHHMPERGRAVVHQALTGDPVRRVGGGGGNVCVRYVSRKMGCVIQAESRTLELAFVEQAEHDAGVRLYLCQPLSLQVRVVDALKRNMRRRYVPDFLVLDDDGFSLVECKPASRLRRDPSKIFPGFEPTDAGWRCPAAEQAAAEFGLRHRVFTSDEVNPVWLRNIRFLDNFLDAPAPDSVLLRSVTDRLAAVGGSLAVPQLLADTEVPAEILWWLVANRRVSADLEHELVFSETSSIHSSHEMMLAARCQREPASDFPRFELSFVRAEPGCALSWNGQPWIVVNSGADSVALQNSAAGTIVSLPVKEFEALARSGALQAADSSEADEVSRRQSELYRRASVKDRAGALWRYQLLQEADATGRVPSGTSERTLRRYRQWIREAEQLYASGFAGLIRFRGRPVGTSGLDEAPQAILDQFVEENWTDPKAVRVTNLHARLVAACGDLHSPSRETLRRALMRRRVAEDVREREGPRAAYQVSGPIALPGDGLWPHADRAFEVAHIDHTPLDVELVSWDTGAPLGSPWLTLMIDDRSRMPLAATLAFDEPSRVSVLAVLRDCVSRHQRVPDNVVVDQGAEFNSVDVEIAFAELPSNKIERPASKPRFGAIVERAFETTNTKFIHELDGNKKLNRLGRGRSATHKPSVLAAWTLSRLHDACEKWLFDVYPRLRHGTLGATPREVFDYSVTLSGVRARRYVANDEALRVLLAMTPEGGTRKVDLVRGIVISYLRYWCDDFGLDDVAGSTVPVKVDPSDCSVVFAYVRKRWQTCRLADGDADFAGRTWKQVHLAVQELVARRRAGAQGREINARILGRFLQETDLEGKLGRQQRRDAEARLTGLSPSSDGATPQLRLVQDNGSVSSPDDARQGRTSPPPSPLILVPDDDDPLREVTPC